MKTPETPFCLRRLNIVLLCLTLTLCSAAQNFGGNPSSTQWKQVNTDTVRVIFPEGLEDAGKRVASVVADLQKQNTNSLGNRLRKVNIVLQNETTVSNAYVGLGPYRSEFYLMPPQNSFELGALNWTDNLSLHEYRHVQQYSNFNVGIAKALSFIFGQQGQAVANSAAIPDYFFEGDAVLNETVLSKQGRGRVPHFFTGYQALYRSKKDYSLMKLRNGSYKDYVPDHYELGYLLVAYGAEKYGNDFWYRVTQDAARFKPLFYPWQGAIKRYAKTSYRQFVDDAFSFYHEKWEKAKSTSITGISKTTNTVSDYKYPYYLPDGKILVLKRGYRQIPAFYKIDNDGSEERIAIRDIAYDDYYSYNNGKIVYATMKPHHRWGNREFSNIVMMDVASGKRQVITRGAKHFSPDVSHNGAMVAMVDMRDNLSSQIEVVDTDGRSVFRSAAKRGIVYTYPKFAKNDSSLFVLPRNEDGEMALVQVDINSAKETVLIPFSNRIYGFPTVQGDTVFFSSSYKGSDELWAYNVVKKETYRIATHPTGFYQAAYNSRNGSLATSNFTAKGHQLVSIGSDQLMWQRLTDVDAITDLYVPGALSRGKGSLPGAGTRSFTVSPYRKTAGFFNFHSWRPLYDLDEFSFTLFGENVLNTFQSELSYTYNRNETSHRAGYTAIYGGWFIQPLAGASHTWDRTIKYNRDTSFHYNESNVHGGFRIPLNLSRGRQFRDLTIHSTFNHQQVKWTGLGKSLLNNGSVNYLEGRVSYSGQVQKALQHIYPRWAQSALLQYRGAVGETEARQFLASGSMYLPGIHVNHSLVVTAAYQQRDTLNQYIFTNNFPFSRGYSAVDFPRMWRLGINYHFPLFYPDLGLAHLVYFHRVRANAFYDMTTARSLRRATNFSFDVVGGEIFFDTKWWNQQPITIGVRFSRLLHADNAGESNKNQWEIVLPVSILD